MTISELSYFLLDNTNVKVAHDGNVVSEYNGKDSINSVFNDKQIMQMYVEDNCLIVEV